MKKHIIPTIVLFFLFAPTILAQPLNLNQVLEAACRINAGNSYGSGTCVAKDDNYYYILTNAHVVGNSSIAYVEFFKHGKQSDKVTGNIIWKAQSRSDYDFAVIAVPTSSLSSIDPRVIPLAPRGYSINSKQYIFAAGSPQARWAQAWEGYVTSANSRVYFIPPPVSGQSGSGIMVNVPDKQGSLHTRVGGLVTWSIPNQNTTIGGGVTTQNLYEALSGQAIYQEIPEYYKEVVHIKCDKCEKCGKCRHQHAMASDFKLYCINYDITGKKFVAGLSPNVQIVHWGEDQCEKPLVNIPRRPRDPPRGPNILPPIEAPWPGDGPPEDNPPEDNPQRPPYNNPVLPKPDGNLLDSLLTQISTLKEQNKKLNTEKETLEENLIAIKKQIEIIEESLDNAENDQRQLTEGLNLEKHKNAELQKSYDELNKDKQKAIENLDHTTADLVINQKKLADTEHALVQKSEQLTMLMSKLHLANEQAQKLTVIVDNHSQVTDTLETQRNGLAGLSTLSLIGVLLFGGLWWRNRLKPKIRKNLGKSKDIIGDIVDKYLGRFKLDILKELEKKSTNSTTENTGGDYKDDDHPDYDDLKDSLNHPNYKKPPGSADKHKPVRPPDMYPSAPYKYHPLYPYTTGYGSIPPEFPSRKHTAEEVLSAVDDIAKQHPKDAILSTYPNLLRQVLEHPKRI